MKGTSCSRSICAAAAKHAAAMDGPSIAAPPLQHPGNHRAPLAFMGRCLQKLVRCFLGICPPSARRLKPDAARYRPWSTQDWTTPSRISLQPSSSHRLPASRQLIGSTVPSERRAACQISWWKHLRASRAEALRSSESPAPVAAWPQSLRYTPSTDERCSPQQSYDDPRPRHAVLGVHFLQTYPSLLWRPKRGGATVRVIRQKTYGPY